VLSSDFDGNKMLKNLKQSAKGLLFSAVLLCGVPAALAQQVGSTGGLGLHWGAGDHYQRVALAYETPSFWQYELSGGWGRLDAVGEFAVAYWSADSARHPGHLWQFSATPLLRWWPGETFFVEAGIGANGFSRTRFADKTISTAFQFGDHIGVGWQITERSRVGLRYSHFSNAGIKKPNPGLDILQLHYLHRF